jgi:hypothetical protein
MQEKNQADARKSRAGREEQKSGIAFLSKWWYNKYTTCGGGYLCKAGVIS